MERWTQLPRDVLNIETPPPAPYTALCTYLPRSDKVDRIRELLIAHWPALRRRDLVTEDPPIIFSGSDASGPFFVEILTWRDLTATARAYWVPEINAIWSEFFSSCEERGTRPGIDYPTVEQIRVDPV